MIAGMMKQRATNPADIERIWKSKRLKSKATEVAIKII
jgi:hypothetical protein